MNFYIFFMIFHDLVMKKNVFSLLQTYVNVKFYEESVFDSFREFKKRYNIKKSKIRYGNCLKEGWSHSVPVCHQ